MLKGTTMGLFFCSFPFSCWVVSSSFHCSICSLFCDSGFGSVVSLFFNVKPCVAFNRHLKKSAVLQHHWKRNKDLNENTHTDSEPVQRAEEPVRAMYEN